MDNNIEKFKGKPVATLETVCKTAQFLMILLPLALAICFLYDIALSFYAKVSSGIAFIVLFLLFLVCDVIKDKYTWQKDPNSLAQDETIRKNYKTAEKL